MANPLMTVTVTVPRDVEFAENLIEVGRELPRDMASVHAQIAKAIVSDHERRSASPLQVVDR
jgi:hypothetical protein